MSAVLNAPTPSSVQRTQTDLAAAQKNGNASTPEQRINKAMRTVEANQAALSNHPNPEHAMRVSRQRGG